MSWPLFLVSARSPAGCRSRKRIHFTNVCQPQSAQEKSHLLPLHVCHRHEEHSICLPRGEGLHPAGQPGGLQPGLTRRAPLLWFSRPGCSWQPGELCGDSVCLTLLLNTIIQTQDVERLQSKSPKRAYYWCVSNFPVRLSEKSTSPPIMKCVSTIKVLL